MSAPKIDRMQDIELELSPGAECFEDGTRPWYGSAEVDGWAFTVSSDRNGVEVDAIRGDGMLGEERCFVRQAPQGPMLGLILANGVAALLGSTKTADEVFASLLAGGFDRLF